MAYLTPNQLILPPGMAEEISQLFAISADLLRAIATSADTTSFDPVDVDQADDAVSDIEEIIREASGQIDAALSRRYVVPITDPSSVPALSEVARALVRYALNAQRDHTGEDMGRIERDQRRALKTLNDWATGALELGGGATKLPTSTSTGSPQVSVSQRVFTADSLYGYTRDLRR